MSTPSDSPGIVVPPPSMMLSGDLAAKFGARYLDYRRRVRRWL